MFYRYIAPRMCLSSLTALMIKMLKQVGGETINQFHHTYVLVCTFWEFVTCIRYQN
jgi:hypothetical protein